MVLTRKEFDVTLKVCRVVVAKVLEFNAQIKFSAHSAYCVVDWKPAWNLVLRVIVEQIRQIDQYYANYIIRWHSIIIVHSKIALESSEDCVI